MSLINYFKFKYMSFGDW